MVLALLLGACTAVPPTKPMVSQARPVVAGTDDQVTVRGMSVRLPAAPGWSRRDVPMPDGAVLYEFERDLPNGNRAQIHVADYFGPSRVLQIELNMSGADDALRLDVFLASLGEALFAPPGTRQSGWADTQREPERRFGAVCRERHEVREDRAEDGILYLWQDWMLFCMDPASHVPIEIDYAERYRADGGIPNPSFPLDAAALFDSIRFEEPDLAARPTAEVTGALIMANDRLFSTVDQRDYPAAVVFSTDPNYPVEKLRPLAARLFRLKGTTPSDPVEQRIAAELTDEIPRYTTFVQVPPTLAGPDPVFIGSLLVHRSLLPLGHIGPGSRYGEFLLTVRLTLATEHQYRLEHVGIQWLQ